MKMKLGSMTFGEILDRGIKMLFSRLPTFFAMGFLLMLPLLVIQLLEPQLRSAAGMAAALITLIVSIVFSFVYSGAVVDVIAKDYLGKPVTVGSAIGYAFKRFGDLFVTALLAGIIIGLGFLLLVIPGIIFAIWYVFATQVVMVEGMGGMKALARSKSLTEGHRGRIFGIIFVIGLLLALINIGLTLGLATVLPIQEIVRTPMGLAGGPINYTNFCITVLIQYLLTIVTSSFQAICVTLMYFDLRVRKEAYDLEVLATQTPE
ncbi:MAG: hypothetical protein QM703_29015 [Gemmatales bacterium]